jgi:hypothetical protein
MNKLYLVFVFCLSLQALGYASLADLEKAYQQFKRKAK